MKKLDYSLMDNFVFQTTKMPELKSAIEEMAKRSKTLAITGTEVTVHGLNAESVPEYQEIVLEKELSILERLSVSDIASINDYKKRRIGKINVVKDIGRELFEEAKANNTLFFRIRGVEYGVSRYSFPTLGQRCGLSGDYLTQRRSAIRDMAIADALFFEDQKINLMYREDGEGHRKIFAFFSPTYKVIPQTALLDVIYQINPPKGFGNPVLYRGSITQVYTDIEIEYPEAEVDGIIPGISLSTSDIGSCAVIVRFTARVKDATEPSIIEEISMKHTKKNEVGDLVSKVNSLIPNLSEFLKAVKKVEGKPYRPEMPGLIITKAYQDPDALSVGDRKAFISKVSDTGYKDALEFGKSLLSVPNLLKRPNRARLESLKKSGAVAMYAIAKNS